MSVIANRSNTPLLQFIAILLIMSFSIGGPSERSVNAQITITPGTDEEAEPEP
ncbi:MAG: hypothetical protein ACRD8W_00115 [Nitrososphaeraceae archaeon]